MPQISTCVGFAALAKADTKFSHGLHFTGVGAVSCVRGEFIMLVGNLQKGERYSLLAFLIQQYWDMPRYAPMDFVFASALQNFMMLLLGVISYDIAC